MKILRYPKVLLTHGRGWATYLSSDNYVFLSNTSELDWLVSLGNKVGLILALAVSLRTTKSHCFQQAKGLALREAEGGGRRHFPSRLKDT